MTIDRGRRQLLSYATTAGLGATLFRPAIAWARSPAIKAVVFDAFPIFNPTSILATARQLVPGAGTELQAAWFQKIFADTWLRTAARQYKPFTDVLAESLDHSAQSLGIVLSRPARDALLGAFWQLEIWPDVREALGRLSEAGLHLAFLSNMSEEMLRSNMRRNGIEPFFKASLSTDRVQAFKPAPEAYALATKALHLTKPEILFAPFAAWDAAGSAWFGFRTAWVNRAQQAPEPGAPPVRSARDLGVVLDIATARTPPTEFRTGG